MDNVSKDFKLLISIIALVSTAVTASFAYSFLGYLDLSRGMKFLYGFLLYLAPMSTFWVVAALWRKEKQKERD